jgi:hypothetical protein
MVRYLGGTIKPEKTDCHYHYLITNLKKCPEFDSGDLGGDRYMNVETILTVPWLMRQQARERERELQRRSRKLLNDELVCKTGTRRRPNNASFKRAI